MPALRYDGLRIEQGGTFRFGFKLTDPDGAGIDLAGFTARMQLRASVDSTAVLAELSTGDDSLSVDLDTSVISGTLSDEQTAGLDYSITQAVYDLFIESDTGEATRVVYGTIPMIKAVTR